MNYSEIFFNFLENYESKILLLLARNDLFDLNSIHYLSQFLINYHLIFHQLYFYLFSLLLVDLLEFSKYEMTR